jgi:hypothetical protein
MPTCTNRPASLVCPILSAISSKSLVLDCVFQKKVLDCYLFYFLFPRIVDDSTKKAAAVDPVEPEKVLKAASEVGASVDCVLTTHHHWYTITS